MGKVIPEGVYDLGRNEGWVSVGIDHDTAAFAVASVAALVAGDGGGGLSGGPAAADHGRRRGQQRLSVAVVEGGVAGLGGRPGPADLGVPFPARDEQMEQDRAPDVLPHHPELAWPAVAIAAIVVNLIGHTTTKTGLRIEAEMDTDTYRTGIKVSDEELAAVQLEKAAFHGEWNYTISPKS